MHLSFPHSILVPVQVMATKQLIESIPLPRNSQICASHTEDKCSNCTIVNEKLASVLIDLKTAEAIISILSADLKLNSDLDVSGEVNINGRVVSNKVQKWCW